MKREEMLRQLEDETVRLLLERTDMSQDDIAQELGVSVSYVQSVAKRRRCQRKPGTFSFARRRQQVT